MYKKILISLVSMAFFISACTTATVTPEVMMEKPTVEMMEEPTEVTMEEPTDVMVEEEMHDSMMDTPVWFDAVLTNVRTGEMFTINDFNGRVVLVENLAMWCSNCKKQQTQVKALNEALGMTEDFVAIGLDVDLNEKAEDLKAYIESNGFDWIYAVATDDVTREISTLYGEQFLNPSSTPILIIDRLGQVHLMPFGIKSVEDLQNFIEPFLSDNM